ncbi:hypothetical protein [Yinghuangia seranimata]|uniref:hypothetical protein n=1 Tax=Yinghuangia seranimata TaxID=408067 RepID=UPI00248B2650|nr:hypothetical protein [Yinghuangia seranimata]MDI2124894.1 hypothetical protein [Yinghuangia seranimata]
MDEWVTATIGAVGALVGALLGGVFAVRGARRQAEATVDAAVRQVTGQLVVMQETFRDQAAVAQREVRRAAYVAFLARVDRARRAQTAYASAAPPTTALRDAWVAAADGMDEALNVVLLEGPDAAAGKAAGLADRVRPGAPTGGYPQAHADFLAAARDALRPAV